MICTQRGGNLLPMGNATVSMLKDLVVKKLVKSLLFKKIHLVLFFFLFYGLIGVANGYGQSLIDSLARGQQPGIAHLQDINWLAGYWKGTGLGGDCEELWMPSVGGGMHGIFRLHENGKLNFTEYMVIEAVENSLVVKIKHYGKGTAPWEDKDEWTSFPLVKIVGETAYFDGITYQRKDDDLVIYVWLKEKGKKTVAEFKFQKAVL